MSGNSSSQINQLLHDWSNGDQTALEKLTPLVYEELRRLAHAYLRRERADQTLQTTALVHEAYLRLLEYKKIHWKERGHFFAIAAQLMRRILVEHARARNRLKRGGAQVKLLVNDVVAVSENRMDELLALDEALTRLATNDARKEKVVELRCFGGLENEEIAQVLHISVNTVMRDWKLAQAWLRRELALIEIHDA